MRVSSLLTFCVLIVLLVGVSGCFSSNPQDIHAFLKPGEVAVTAKEYVLQPPDEIEIHCTRVPEIHLRRQRIRPDGNVTFEGIGDISVAGKTPAEVADLLKKQVSGLYTLAGDKPIDVHVAAYRSKFFYVMGEAYLPGRKVYTGRDTLFSILADARPNPMAWKSRIQIIRPSSDRKVKAKIFEFNLKDALLRGDLSKDVLLQEGDIVYIPPTPLAWVAQRVEEFVRPIGRAFSTVSIVNRSSTGGSGGGGY
ncbi:MAG: hypothetical protein FVQ82_02380 [Planctomycetes bacterium]|nr:hypothetical protein [Planctomycetota bacterium]